jgi:hypothetical protein
MDHDYYKLKICPFCGEQLDEDDSYDEQPESE